MEMDTYSFVKLYRKFTGWEWYGDSNMVHMFIHLLINANYEARNWRGIEVKRGELVTGRKSLASELNMSEQQVRTCLNKLKSTNEITTKSTNKYTIITVCNYDSYQSNQQHHQPTEQPTTQPTSNQQSTTPKESKNKRKVFIAPTVDQVREYCVTRNNNVDPQRFVDYYEARGWMIGKNKMRSWQAAVRTWEGNTKSEKTNTFDPSKL